MKKGHNQAPLKETIEALSRIEDQIQHETEKHLAPLRGERKDIYAEAKANGYTPRALKEALRRFRLDKETREIVEVYEGSIFDICD